MCGIAGIYKLKGQVNPDDIQAVQRMMDAQVHRGPDGSGLYHDDHIVLGHRRLSIIDLSEAGKQPMSNEGCPECSRKNTRAWITYNGEIYNYQALRSELIRTGHKFKSNSDTEIIIHGYVEWGIVVLIERLRGMFAFALYDSGLINSELRTHNSKLFLVRDRLGIKPLYYYINNQKVIFSSEVKPIVRSGLIPVEHNKEADIAFLIFGSVPEPLTTIGDVLSLPSGSYISIENGSKKIVQYYDLLNSFSKHKMNDSGSIFRDLHSILDESLNIHQISDAPLGVFLSGGIDSSALVALASEKRDKPLTTLSIIFDEEEYSELPYQRMIAEKYKTDHIEIKVTEKDFYDEIDNIFEAMDQPTVDGVNTYFVSRAAKRAGLKAVLSGTGGDEVFCGYDSFKKIGLLREINGFPGILRFPFSFASNLNSSWNKLSYLKNDAPLSLYLTLRGLFIPKDVAKILDISENEVRNVLEGLQLKTPNSELQTLEPIDWLSYMELSFYLKNQLLKDSDFMSMYHSVETRVPFLDHILVDYIASVNSALKLDKNTSKPLLVNSLNHFTQNNDLMTQFPNDLINKLPGEIVFRKKQGFTFPFDNWIRKNGKGVFDGAIQKSSINKKYARDLWRNFEQRKLHWSRLWALVVLERFESDKKNFVL